MPSCNFLFEYLDKKIQKQSDSLILMETLIDVANELVQIELKSKNEDLCLFFSKFLLNLLEQADLI